MRSPQTGCLGPKERECLRERMPNTKDSHDRWGAGMADRRGTGTESTGRRIVAMRLTVDEARVELFKELGPFFFCAADNGLFHHGRG